MNVHGLNSLGASYQRLVGEIRVERYEVALNSASESVLVGRAYDNGGRYDPQFEFTPVDNSALTRLKLFRTELNSFADEWLDPMRSSLNYMERSLIDHDAHLADATTARTRAMFGDISATTLEGARQLLDRRFEPYTDEKEFDATRIVSTFRDALENVSLTEWTVELAERMNAMMDVSAERREIRIRKGTVLSRIAIERLIVHEIGCHVFRSASGTRQPIQLLGLSLGDYLATEEGLGCYREEQTGLEDPTDSRRLALRYLGAALSLEKPLFDVYTELRDYADHEQAFETAMRAKRGIADTRQPGCHLKDKVYYEGIQLVSDHLKAHPEDEDVLYVGKVSLGMLPFVKEALSRGDLTEAAFTSKLVPQLQAAIPRGV